MKKYLLGLLAIPLGFIAFSIADIISFSCPSEGDCSPISTNISAENCVNYVSQLSISDLNCEDTSSECGVELYSEDGVNLYTIVYNEGELTENFCSVGSDDTLYYFSNYNPDNPVAGKLNILYSNTGGGDDNTGGDSGESGELIGQLTPVIDGLGSSMSEFIPYVVYVGLGVLGVIIGFVAIKWLMNYVRGKSLGTFNSRRRK